MRGISINLGNFFSSYVPLLDSFHVAPIKPRVSDETVSYDDKLLGMFCVYVCIFNSRWSFRTRKAGRDT